MEAFETIAARCAELARQRTPESASAPEKVETLERIAGEAQEVGFSARLLVQATLPHSKPAAGVTEFERSNGHVTVRIEAPARYGLPYGTYPRLLLAWVTTEAVRTKSPELELGRSLSEFMGKLDLTKGGGPQGSVPRLRQHMQRLFTSTVSATIERDGELHNIGFRPVERLSLLWDPKRPGQGTLWQSTLRLGPSFFEEIVNHPVPVDMAALRALAKERSPMALDLYLWLTYRMSYLRRPTTIPWKALALQFGSDYGRPRAFKAKLLGHLRRVVEVYPQANVEPEAGGLVLRPSRTHVPMRALPGGRR